jgi:peroxiredoxin Q/BCP
MYLTPPRRGIGKSISNEGERIMKVSRILTGLVPVAAMVLALSQPVVSRADDMPAVGAPAPDFTLTSQEGKTVNLHDFKGQWVVLYFYPKDFTQGCTIEAHNFERDKAQYDTRKAAIVGVSVDTVDSHQQFCTKESLTFKLLADPDKKVVTRYASVQTIPSIGTVAARNTFLIDPQGVIRKVFVKVNPNPHSEEVLAALDQLKK